MVAEDTHVLLALFVNASASSARAIELAVHRGWQLFRRSAVLRLLVLKARDADPLDLQERDPVVRDAAS